MDRHPQESEREKKLILANFYVTDISPVNSVEVWAMAASLVFYNTTSSYFGGHWNIKRNKEEKKFSFVFNHDCC